MDHNQKLVMLERWVDAGKKIDKVQNSLVELFRVNPENEITLSSYGVFDAYTDALACLLGDDDQWLEWFAYELNFGAKHGEVTIHLDTSPDEGEIIVVKTPADLLRCMG